MSSSSSSPTWSRLAASLHPSTLLAFSVSIRGTDIEALFFRYSLNDADAAMATFDTFALEMSLGHLPPAMLSASAAQLGLTSALGGAQLVAQRELTLQLGHVAVVKADTKARASGPVTSSTMGDDVIEVVRVRPVFGLPTSLLVMETWQPRERVVRPQRRGHVVVQRASEEESGADGDDDYVISDEDDEDEEDDDVSDESDESDDDTDASGEAFLDASEMTPRGRKSGVSPPRSPGSSSASEDDDSFYSPSDPISGPPTADVCLYTFLTDFDGAVDVSLNLALYQYLQDMARTYAARVGEEQGRRGADEHQADTSGHVVTQLPPSLMSAGSARRRKHSKGRRAHHVARSGSSSADDDVSSGSASGVSKHKRRPRRKRVTAFHPLLPMQLEPQLKALGDATPSIKSVLSWLGVRRETIPEAVHKGLALQIEGAAASVMRMVLKRRGVIEEDDE